MQFMLFGMLFRYAIGMTRVAVLLGIGFFFKVPVQRGPSFKHWIHFECRRLYVSIMFETFMTSIREVTKLVNGYFYEM